MIWHWIYDRNDPFASYCNQSMSCGYWWLTRTIKIKKTNDLRRKIFYIFFIKYILNKQTKFGSETTNSEIARAIWKVRNDPKPTRSIHKTEMTSTLLGNNLSGWSNFRGHGLPQNCFSWFKLWTDDNVRAIIETRRA